MQVRPVHACTQPTSPGMTWTGVQQLAHCDKGRTGRALVSHTGDRGVRRPVMTPGLSRGPRSGSSSRIRPALSVRNWGLVGAKDSQRPAGPPQVTSRVKKFPRVGERAGVSGATVNAWRLRPLGLPHMTTYWVGSKSDAGLAGTTPYHRTTRMAGRCEGWPVYR